MDNETSQTIIVIGGGAAGFFSALAAKDEDPEATVILLEGSAKPLAKVRISGGGRCNVTHACFDPAALIKNYPRGSKELLGPFHRFQPRDTVQWFSDREVTLKEESDGRMFPDTDSSETVINCFVNEAWTKGIAIRPRTKVERIEKEGDQFRLSIRGGDIFSADRLILASGSSPVGWELAKGLGHSIQEAVPSLFTFNIPRFALKDLPGVSVESATLRLAESNHSQTGPLLITHWGFSGPAALKLSAWEARLLAERKYQTELLVDWLPSKSEAELRQSLETFRKEHAAKRLSKMRMENLPKSLWHVLCEKSGVPIDLPCNALANAHLNSLLSVLKHDRYQVEGKTTNKEEFVTCGGVTLSEVSFKTMESKICPGLYFCGEVLDIDGVTGGFNFQNAWTTGWIAGRSAVAQESLPF